MLCSVTEYELYNTICIVLCEAEDAFVVNEIIKAADRSAFLVLTSIAKSK